MRPSPAGITDPVLAVGDPSNLAERGLHQAECSRGTPGDSEAHVTKGEDRLSSDWRGSSPGVGEFPRDGLVVNSVVVAAGTNQPCHIPVPEEGRAVPGQEGNSSVRRAVPPDFVAVGFLNQKTAADPGGVS